MIERRICPEWWRKMYSWRPPPSLAALRGACFTLSGLMVFSGSGDDFDSRSCGYQIKQFDQVGIAHPDATMRVGDAELRRIRCAMNVDVAAHRVICTQPVEADLATG